jgi:hypothetical protein
MLKPLVHLSVDNHRYVIEVLNSEAAGFRPLSDIVCVGITGGEAHSQIADTARVFHGANAYLGAQELFYPNHKEVSESTRREFHIMFCQIDPVQYNLALPLEEKRLQSD